MFDTLKSNLEQKNYSVRVFRTGAEAVDYLAETITGATVAFGGSMTLEELGLYDRLAETNAVLWHWRRPEGGSAKAALTASRNASVYICSVNAIAETGELVNIDGNGNRVGESCFGHERVYFVVGRNKITRTLDAALRRAREIAAPLNAQRLSGAATAANVDRICRVTTIFNAAPFMAKYEVVLIDEDLGF